MQLIKENGLKIMQLTDIHIGSYPFEPKDIRTFAALRAAIVAADPDLIMITGDLIWSEGVDRPQRGYQALVDLFNEFDYPIAMTYGNHDSEETIDRSDLRELENGFKNRIAKQNSFIDHRDKECYTFELGNSAGITNVCYVFDSGNHGDLPGTDYDWISLEQIAWYERTHADYLAKIGPTRDLVFLHIPLPEYLQAGEHILAGHFWEDDRRVSGAVLNSGLFAHLRYNDHVAGVFCGHDHDNNFFGEFLGLNLIYGNVSGYNCYGQLPRGYRMIEVKPEGLTTSLHQYGPTAPVKNIPFPHEHLAQLARFASDDLEKPNNFWKQ
ncbi:metallophosphoesterase [Lapidilactobacillus luobeiensis]|uniref:metallophosphoesterase n=1 Tax=Lapidilactobacillus luobeiensis TaxID=2950371 RepID=UPI0021C34F37|nr:metallophosphoesterase [Lapidilactobacillus luobeiensis]